MRVGTATRRTVNAELPVCVHEQGHRLGSNTPKDQKGARMVVRRLVTIGASIASLAAVGVATLPGTANAAESNCHSGNICLWEDGPFVNGTGHRMLTFSARGRYDLGASFGFNDQMSSWANFTSLPACWYENGNLTGRHFMNPGTASSTVVPNDSASVLIIGSC
jgi:hypothetical protein